MADATPPAHEGRARTIREMVFFASLYPCPDCGAEFPEDFHTAGNPDSWALTATCPRCGRPRSFAFLTHGDPLKGAYRYRELGGSSPSEVIRPMQFLVELDRMRASLPDDIALEQLSPGPWRAAAASNNRAITCVLELLKFLPAGAADIPDAALGPDERADRARRPERYGCAWLEAQRDWLFALDKRFNADAPRIWALEET